MGYLLQQLSINITNVRYLVLCYTSRLSNIEAWWTRMDLYIVANINTPTDDDLLSTRVTLRTFKKNGVSFDDIDDTNIFGNFIETIKPFLRGNWVKWLLGTTQAAMR